MISFLHALIFYGFVFYFLVNLVDVLEGFFGIHARGGAWNLFNLAADFLTASVLIGIVGMVIRRLFVRPKILNFPPTRRCSRKFARESFAIPRSSRASLSFMSAAGCCLRRRSWRSKEAIRFSP